MGRKRHEPARLNGGQIQVVRYRFLAATNRVCPDVAEGLKEVGGKGRRFAEWSEKFGIRDTWVERAAESTLAAWEKNPAFKNEACWFLPPISGDHPYGYPDFLRMHQWLDGFQLTSYLFSPATQKGLLHAALDDDLKEIETWAASEELTVQKLIPGDLEQKLECAALYLYQGWTLDQLRARDGCSTTRSNMSSWIHQALVLLQLPMRHRGHR